MFIHTHVLQRRVRVRCTCVSLLHTQRPTGVGDKHTHTVFGETCGLHQQYQQSTGAAELHQTGHYTDQLQPLHALNDIHFVALHVLRRGCPAPHRLAYSEDH